jgi:transposase
MDRARVHEGVRRMRFEDVLGRWDRSELSQLEAAELLGVCERTFRRWRDRYWEAGLAGLADGRLRPSLRRAPAAEIERMLGLHRDLYRGFTVKHFHEQLVKRHGYVLGYTVTKLRLQRAGLVAVARKRSAHRKKRPRRPMVGMLLHQDASRHAWLAGVDRQDDLVVTLDDATSEIHSAFLVAEEGTASSLRGLREVVAAQGLFCALYTDRGSHYFHTTPEAGEAVAKTQLTQVGRALRQLGIEHITAYSQEARGHLAGGARPLGAGVPDAAGPAAEGVGPGWHCHGGGGQLLAGWLAGWRRSTSRSTTLPLRWRPSRRARASCRMGRRPGGTFSACRRTAWLATTTR